ncbi:TPA: hypothetical protein DCL28_03205 [Candidatus Komeilibacteria bacterium]|nr:MAG: hypothetical protein A3J95_03905 [Candidatus Komeilibacteria bacterium RIFOXYC2_FULL_45_12]HAH04538.1 hypothetical protein [Candidatus Komeilibacteria bacterium]HCC74073.1 hypothetical protein [Candidatus Komeilibacteria bacterium]
MKDVFKLNIKKDHIFDDLENIVIYLKHENNFKEFIQLYFKLMFVKYNQIYYLTPLQNYFSKWNYEKEFNKLGLPFNIFRNVHKNKFLFLNFNIKEKFLLIKFTNTDQSTNFFEKYLGFFQESYFLINSQLDINNFVEENKGTIVFKDFIKDNSREMIEKMINNFDILNFYGQDWTYFEITRKDKKLLNDLFLNLKNMGVV